MIDIPSALRLKMVKGNTVPLYINLSNNCCQYNLTDATVWFTVKRSLPDLDANAIMQKIYPASLAIPDASSGMIKISFTTADTINLPDWVVTYGWDLQIKDANSIYLTGIQGTLTIYPSWTITK